MFNRSFLHNLLPPMPCRKSLTGCKAGFDSIVNIFTSEDLTLKILAKICNGLKINIVSDSPRSEPTHRGFYYDIVIIKPPTQGVIIHTFNFQEPHLSLIYCYSRITCGCDIFLWAHSTHLIYSYLTLASFESVLSAHFHIKQTHHIF